MRYYRTGKDDSWNRPIWKDANGQIFVDINCGDFAKVLLHDVTSEGEPCSLIADFPNFESYSGLKLRHEKEVNAFPMGFAFNNDQLKSECERLGVEDPKTELVSISAGGFIKKGDKEDYVAMLDGIHADLDKALENDSFMIEAFLYELANHEYCITYDPKQTLDVLGLSRDEQRVEECFQIAKREYLQNQETY